MSNEYEGIPSASDVAILQLLDKLIDLIVPDGSAGGAGKTRDPNDPNDPNNKKSLENPNFPPDNPNNGA